MKIWLRLTLGFGLIILLMLTISGTAAWRMTDTQTSNQLLQESQVTTALVLELSRYVDVNANQTEALTRITNFGDIKEFQQRFDASLSRINELFEQLGNIKLTTQAQPFYQDLIKARDEYNVHRDKILGYVAEGNIMEVIADDQLPGLLNNYMEKINSMVEHQSEATTMLFDESNEEGEIGLLILGVVTALALVLGPIWALVVTRSISLPLANTVTVAQSVARRDLNQSLKPHGHDEIATLEQSLSEMVTGLQQAVGEIRQGSEAIESAASEISAGNLDLSTRTEQQASSLAETAASMEQITSTVRQSGDNAQQANGLAQAAAQTAHEGEAVVSELVAIMNDVNSKAQQIADIIAVIDSIAFQTNILALNAAVEAARAGEQGRGFAVVASEVRALAQRSAASAREIGELIGSSVEVISQGAEQTDKAGASMQQINNSITKVADIIGEINAASKEQIIGIEQINTAISQMDEATRSNATLVEESAAASSSLQEQTAALNRLVASFRLNSASGASKAQPKPKSQTKEATIKQAQPKTRDITPKAPALEHKTAPKHDDWTEF